MVELLPLALVITASPTSIIPAVLVLHAPHPRRSSIAYLAGWLVGLAALTSIAIEVSNMLEALRAEPPSWAAWLRIGVGSLLIGAGVIRWLTRRSDDHMPGWMRAFTTITPARAAALGAALCVVNLKVLLICAAAGLAIGADDLGNIGTVLSAALFVAVAASSVALPVLAYAVAGDRLDPPLTRLKEWLVRHDQAAVAAILLLIGIVVLYKGIHAL